MNAREAFPGTGMQQPYTEDEIEEQKAQQARLFEQRLSSASQHDTADDAFADAVQGALSEPIPTGTDKDRGIFERSLAARRLEKAKQQAIAAAANAKIRALTLSIRSMEDALDALLVSTEA